ncbi:FAD/NAD(P)-binding domain-containing protein [Rhizoclosmatium globosum]|uniref:FAD/NAD(P)-binding domain-containing protein n=1 Tax=Rhizoclosmatium globosum TaxID=329046 RepID=A0A1Y2CW87_9FUNG|nr:FAD/NAD(P)-binding domain-containing protein [Rhizoclosmatium globosum]|eukprot:ORY51094.1 FAD/NAD(P)-binding domain-containing protein [Rhizoclosmatium globosum]
MEMEDDLEDELHECRIQPTLYDKVSTSNDTNDQPIQFGEVGGDFSMLGNGIKALQHLGLTGVLDEIKQGVPLEEYNFLLLDGSDRIGQKTQKKGEVESYQVLRDSNFGGKRIKNLEQTADDVTVQFEDGTVVVADIVVGADEAFGTGYVGVVDLGERTDGTVVDFKHNAGIYGDPLNSRLIAGARCGKDVGAFFVVDLNPKKLFDAGDDWRPFSDLPKESALLADTVASWGADQSVVNCIRYSKRVTPANLYDLPDLKTFYKGRVVLIGDAAHGTIPFYGQGFNQALEDAGVLADLMGHFQDDFKTAFEKYDQIRIPRTRLCSETARKTGSRMKASSKAEARIGRFIMRMVFTLQNAFGFDDEVYYHDFRQDVQQAVPDIKLI